MCGQLQCFCYVILIRNGIRGFGHDRKGVENIASTVQHVNQTLRHCRILPAIRSKWRSSVGQAQDTTPKSHRTPPMSGTILRAQDSGGSSMSSAQMLTGPETHSGVMWKMRAAISSTSRANPQTGEANRLLGGVGAQRGAARQTEKSRIGCACPRPQSQIERGSHPTVAAKQAFFPISSSCRAKVS